MNLDEQLILRDKHALFEAVDSFVSGQLFKAIRPLGARRDDLDDQDRLPACVSVTAGCIASYDYVGIVIGICVDHHFHVRYESSTGATAQKIQQAGVHGAGDKVVAIACACHGEDMAIDILVPSRALLLAVEVVFKADEFYRLP